MIAPPRQLVLETSGACQLSCPQCWKGLHWTNRNDFMGLELFDRIADEAQGFIRHAYLHLWGEPTLNPLLPYMIGRMHEFSTIDISTHGLGLTEELAEVLALCEVVCVSIDGTDQETYSKYRVGGDLDRALDGLRLLIKTCPPTHLRWLFVVFKENEHQIPLAREMADNLGVRIEFKSPAFWDTAKMTESMPSDEQYRRHELRHDGWHLKANRLNCREFWETAYVLPNADMVTCCYDGKAQFVVGNVREQSLLDVWNGEAYQSLRDKHLGGQLNPLCEQYCNMRN